MTDRPMIRWLVGVVEDPDGLRELTREELETMNKAEKIFVKIDVEDRPAGIGETLVKVGMEAWLAWFDREGCKMIYRKTDPADMVPPDEGEEGIRDNER